jgi:hypothetical protein
VSDDWESPEHVIAVPVSRPWTNAALFCGTVALGLEATSVVLAVSGFVTMFSGGPTRFEDVLMQLVLVASTALAGAGVGCGLVSLMRREARVLPAVAVVLSLIALWPLSWIAR